MSNIIEENAKFFADYLKSLSILSYDEIVNMVKDKDNIYQIEFYDQFDLYNEIHYSCVSIMKNNDTSALERYVTEDQDVKAVYTNLISKLRDNDIEPILQQVWMYSSGPNFVCRIGLNDIILPVELTEDLMDKKCLSVNRRKDDVCCMSGYYVPGQLTNIKDKNKSKKIK